MISYYQIIFQIFALSKASHKLNPSEQRNLM